MFEYNPARDQEAESLGFQQEMAARVRRLHDALNGFGPSDAPYDDEAEVSTVLPTLSYLEPDRFDVGDEASVSMIRSRVRYLAAAFDPTTTVALAPVISGVVGNQHLSVKDIQYILEARVLGDPSRRTREVDFDKIQMAGVLLRAGQSLTATAKAVGISYDTVEAIDKYLGLREARRQKLIERACNAVRDGLSVRAFASQIAEPPASAHRLIVKARQVLAEIGEVA